jgi:hypothetical protein
MKRWTIVVSLLLACLTLPLAAAQDTEESDDANLKEEVRDYPPDLTEHIRPALPQDYNPGGKPALTVVPGISIVDVVVSNTNTNLKNTNTTPNSEPSIAINPNNTNQIVVLAFSGGWGATAPLWYTTNGGTTWTLENSIPNPPGLTQDGCPCDQTPDYAASGKMSATFLHTDNAGIDVYSSMTTGPATKSDWKWFTSGGITQTTNQTGTGNVDQPWLLMGVDPQKAGQYNTYVAYDDFDGAPDMHVAVAEGTDPPDFTLDNFVGFSGGAINPGQRLGKDITRHIIYSLWQLCPTNLDPNCTNQNANPKTIYYYLNRSTDGGRTWSLNGTTTGWLAAVGQSTQPNPKFGTVNALLGGVDHIAVDSNSGDVYIVFGNRDSKTGNNRLSIERLTSDGAGGLKVASTAFVTAQSQTALPSVAVAQNSKGTVGVLYTRYDGIDSATKLPKFSVWLAQSDDHGLTFSHTQLESFLSPVGNNGNSRQRVLGDYQQLKAWGGTFYGVFAGNGVPFGRPFANIDPIFFKTTPTN